MERQFFYMTGPYGEEYEIFYDDDPAQEPMYIGRVYGQNHAEAMIDFAIDDNWDMVEALQHRPQVDSGE